MKEAVATLKRLCRQRTVLTWKEWREAIEKDRRQPTLQVQCLSECFITAHLSALWASCQQTHCLKSTQNANSSAASHLARLHAKGGKRPDWELCCQRCIHAHIVRQTAVPASDAQADAEGPQHTEPQSLRCLLPHIDPAVLTCSALRLSWRARSQH